MDAIDRYGKALVIAGQRRTEDRLGRWPSGSRLRRPTRLRFVPAVALVVLGLASVAFAASHIFATGAPLKPPYGEVLRPTSRDGLAIPSSIQMLPVAVRDPVGGPAWGMRFEQTTRGLGCLQIARLVNGRLGILGQDHAFHNDGQFHPLPASIFGAFQCSDLDAHDHAYLAINGLATTASAFPDFGCLPAGDKRLQHEPGTPICVLGDTRLLYYGLLGPEAVSVTYRTPNGRLLRIPTVGSQGAYLIVSAPRHVPNSISPAYSPTPPIVRVGYRDGHSCDTHSRSCPPVGYVPQPLPRPTTAQVASRIHVVEHAAAHPPTIVLSFLARYPVKNIDSAYGIAVTPLSAPRSATCSAVGSEGVNLTQDNVRVGQQIRFTWQLQPGCPGRLRVAAFFATQRSAPGLPAFNFQPPDRAPNPVDGVSRLVGSQVIAIR